MCVLYDKLSKTLQHANNAAGFILPQSLCPLYTLWMDNSDLEQNGLGWSPSCEPENEEWGNEEEVKASEERYTMKKQVTIAL